MSCELDVSLMDLTLTELQMVHYLLHLPVCEALRHDEARLLSVT